jgi:lysophospholipid acyltransferase (LPLAT)-like uncharacterized protein
MRIIKTLGSKSWVRWLLGHLIAFYGRLVWRTSRWTTVGMEPVHALWAADRPFIVCFWHGRMLMTPFAWQRGRPVRMLISAHRDGRIIAETMRHFAIDTLAGSTRRGGSQALRAMLRTLSDGISIGITPDGPRGPRMRVSMGAVTVARMSGAPIIPLTYATSHRVILGSWDRFHLPLPFGRGIFIIGEPIAVGREEDLEAARRRLEEAMIRDARAADRHVGRVPIEPAAETADA